MNLFFYFRIPNIMLRRDLLKAQIEHMERVLAEALTQFFRLKSNHNLTDRLKIIHIGIQTKLKLDINHILKLSNEELSTTIEQKNLTPDHLEHLANYLSGLGSILTEEDNQMAKLYLEKSLYFYQLTDTLSKTLSFERLEKSKKIKNQLSQL